MATSRNGSGSSNHHNRQAEEEAENPALWSNQNRGVEGVQQDPTSQPPPPPVDGLSWAQIMANQAQLINLLSQSMANTQSLQATAAAQPQAQVPPPLRSSIAEFMRLRPPTFSSSTEPMEADDWLRAVGRKLDMVQCTDHERVSFAAHQLSGPASEWWDNFSQSHADGQAITWDEFMQAFRRAHIPAGMMTLKRKEFRSLRQGSRTVSEYLHKFNQLARYAPGDIASDEAKQERFLEGLNDEIAVHLVAPEHSDFQ